MTPSRRAAETILLVGGPADGRRVMIDGRPKVYFVPRINRLDLSLDPDENPMQAVHMSRIAEEYVRSERQVYLHSSISHMDVVEALVAGYRHEIGQ